jgi:hypothetical protein
VPELLPSPELFADALVTIPQPDRPASKVKARTRQVIFFTFLFMNPVYPFDTYKKYSL